MAQNGPERAETVQNDIYAVDGPCGALIGVALIYFAAGILVMGAIWAFVIR